MTPPADVRCPVCGEGVLGDIAYDDYRPQPSVPKQAPESRELLTFSCGHEAEAGWLEEAARDDQNVERRRTPETVEPIRPEGGTP